MELLGQRARVLIEIETDAGDRIQFPLDHVEWTGTWLAGDDSPFNPGRRGYGELRIPFRDGFLARVLDTLDQYTFRTGRH